MATGVEFITRRELLREHLSTGHYPPLSERFIEVAETALDHLAATDNEGAEIILPNGITFYGSDTAIVEHVIESLHLWDFISN
jgi:hypothetical protein